MALTPVTVASFMIAAISFNIEHTTIYINRN